MVRKWHLLSLDAPSVAVLWTWFVSTTFERSVSPYLLGSMFLSVWIVYVVDRILDHTKAPKTRETICERHHFHFEHRSALFIFIAASLLFLPPLVLQIPLIDLIHYLVLLVFVGIYFILVHSIPVRFPKELSVGAIFAFATFVPALTFVGFDLSVFLQIALTACLFTHNCLLIDFWEQGKGSKALLHSNLILFVALAVATLACAIAKDSVVLACSSSMLLLLGLDYFHNRIEPVQSRALADLALFTPLVAIWV